MMAILHEIHVSGFADMLRSGLVITGGSAQIANLGNFIYDLSGYRVRTGYPRRLFSCQGCEGINETSAATSMGLIMMAAKESEINCTQPGTFVPSDSIVVPPSLELPAQEEVRTTLFTDEEMGKVDFEKVKRRKREENNLTFSEKITKFWGTLYDNVSNEKI